MSSPAGPCPQASSPLPLRFCSTCHKPFLKEASYTRHVLYCRRAQHRARTRARACRPCNRAKVKCPPAAPQSSACLRCRNKGLPCTYDTTAAADEHEPSEHEAPPENAAPPVPSGGGDTPEALDVWDGFAATPAVDEAQAGLSWDDIALTTGESLPAIPEEAMSYLSGLGMGSMAHEMPWGGIGQDAGCVGGLGSACDPQDLAVSRPGPSGRCAAPDASFPALVRSSGLSAQPDDSSFLSRLPMADPVAHCTADVVLQMLRAFPHMMLRRETFPPFIHAHWHHPAHAAEPALPTLLVSCMGMAQVFTSHGLETRPFLWRAIQAEQRSAANKSDQRLLSKHDLLAAVQAQLIYIIMRIIDHSSHAPPGLNLEMLVVYQSLCERFKDACNQPFFQDERLHPSSDWEEWIFSESRRRTVVVWLLLTYLVQSKIGVRCDSFDGFRDIPVPAPRALWEATTRPVWHAEYEIYKTMPRGGIDTLGDLMVCKQRDTRPDKLKLDAWNCTVDSLGILLNLAAPIL